MDKADFERQKDRVKRATEIEDELSRIDFDLHEIKASERLRTAVADVRQNLRSEMSLEALVVCISAVLQNRAEILKQELAAL